VSPATLRRYRAERLLRQEFEVLRTRVIVTVRGRLLASGVRLDRSDLEACYAQAWQGLYAAVLDGHQIVNPAGWLVLVTFRRAIEEHRARRRDVSETGSSPDGVEVRDAGAHDRDLAAELDDRIRLRQLFEGLRGRLNARELQAATLCYLHGLTRAEAAARMGVSQARMRKLMEGQGSDRPGVASKVGTLVETIREGGWCAEQASLMRGYAYGILDPQGDRHRLARVHRDECPACRAYVTSLRGLAAALPPVFPPWPLAAAVLAGAGTQAGTGVGGALSASGAAGAGGTAGAAGGSWLLAGGPLGAKLAAGCLLAIGVGVGCVALGAGPDRGREGVHLRGSVRVERLLSPTLAGRPAAPALGAGRASSSGVRARARPLPVGSTAPPDTIVREFGPEQGGEGGAPASVAAAGRQAARPTANAAQREFGPG
jgi:DNA-directed RNA polymerase specialized sigma24 family protein